MLVEAPDQVEIDFDGGRERRSVMHGIQKGCTHVRRDYQ
jgi:hypothetical protein